MKENFKNPSYDLEAVQAAVKFNSLYTTTTCLQDAAALGYNLSGIKNIFLDLRSCHFYKTMPSNNNDGTMQDVYRYPDGEFLLYIKFKFVNDVLVLSFKEK